MVEVKYFVGAQKDGQGNPLPVPYVRQALRRIKTTLAKEYGGYTETTAAGGWLNPQGVLVEETSRVFTVLCDKSGREARQRASTLAAEFAAALRQHSVLLTVTRASAASVSGLPQADFVEHAKAA